MNGPIIKIFFYKFRIVLFCFCLF